MIRDIGESHLHIGKACERVIEKGPKSDRDDEGICDYRRKEDGVHELEGSIPAVERISSGESISNGVNSRKYKINSKARIADVCQVREI
jgi:hypothetical protein